MLSLGNHQTAKHLYELTVSKEGRKIEVHANTRSQARVIAERAGYVVRDVNMVG